MSGGKPTIGTIFPEAFKAQAGLTQAIWRKGEEAGVGRDLIELVYLRCSQLNGCAFCLDVHHREGLKAGLTELKASVVPAWREAHGIFDEEEQAALAIAEIVSDPARVPFTEEEYLEAVDVLGEERAAVLAWAGICMNGWNRMHAVSGTPVGG
ncbi:carboxymuconolactone decarboxylase family protein [Corynebacterium sp.]|uniref:carboxymuconolactone decarboxylase family protein n=1 Tax=Corynebacterium sp. TaxID=1720 RepID=UPI0026DC89CA|nr:carboxymuconolactone decarboxylase family protein [Corynebacterium sp.]MDO4610755.1 carboxymuconolactone decarboxylase family protein [Corynebacterium sp.]